VFSLTTKKRKNKVNKQERKEKERIVIGSKLREKTLSIKE